MNYAYFIAASSPTPKTLPNAVLVVIPNNGDEHYFFAWRGSRTHERDWRDPQYWAPVPAKSSIAGYIGSLFTTGLTPRREWSVPIPDSLNRKNAEAVTDWLRDTTLQFDGTSTYVGTPIPILGKDEFFDHAHNRAYQTINGSLQAIQLYAPEDDPTREPEPVSTLVGDKEYVRPNGEIYYSRQWSGHTDVEVLRQAREVFLPALLLSPPGTGKTAAIEAAYGEDLYTVVGSADTTAADLIGNYVAMPDGTILWVDGPAVKAAEEGKVLFLDEVGLIDTKELSAIYSLMDGRGVLTVTANPARELVRAAPGFFVVGATNPHAPGVRLSEALLSRYTLKATMTTDYMILETKLGVNPAICRIGANLSQMMESGDIDWAPQFRELAAYHKAEQTFGRDFAVANLLADAPEEDRSTVADVIRGGLGINVKDARIV